MKTYVYEWVQVFFPIDPIMQWGGDTGKTDPLKPRTKMKHINLSRKAKYRNYGCYNVEVIFVLATVSLTSF